MRIDPEIMARIRSAILNALPTTGEPMAPGELHAMVVKRLTASGATAEIGRSQITSAIKWLRDRNQIRSIRYAGNTARYLKTGNVVRRMANSRSPAKSCDLIFPDRQLHPMEFTAYLLAQSQFSAGRIEIL